MSDETTPAPTPGEVEPWDRLLDDAATIESELREAGWEAVSIDPESVSPVETDDRVGFRAIVGDEEYDAVERVVRRPEVAFTAVDVYRQTEGRTTVVLAVERDDESQTAVLVPLYYERPEARSVVETALADGRLLVYVETAGGDTWVVFSHDDPSLFVENVEEFEPGRTEEAALDAGAGFESGDEIEPGAAESEEGTAHTAELDADSSPADEFVEPVGDAETDEGAERDADDPETDEDTERDADDANAAELEADESAREEREP